MTEADTAAAVTPQAPLEVLSLPPIAIENILRSASFCGAIAACSCRTLKYAWRELTSSNPEFIATALVERFQTVDAAAEHIYKPGPGLSSALLVKTNIAPPVPGLLDAVASPLLAILSAQLKKRPSVPTFGYLTATGASDAHALALLRHLWSLRKAAGRRAADPAADSQANKNGDGEHANQGGPLGNQAQETHSDARFPPRSVETGAAFAGHEATVVELLMHGSNPMYAMLPGAVRAGNARLCAALLEADRMAEAVGKWAAAAGGDVLRIRGNPSGFVDSYAGSDDATLHMASIYLRLLPLTYIRPPLGLGGGNGSVNGSSSSGGGGGSSSSRTVEGHGAASNVGAGHLSARGLLQRAVGGWSRGPDHVKPAEEVAAALAAARSAAEKAVDMALGDSSPLLQLCVQSGAAAAAVAAFAATAAALAALTRPEASCSGSSSSGRGGGGGGGSRGGSSSAHISGQACAFLPSTTNHAAVRQLLLQWKPAEWQAPPPHIRAAALLDAAAVGAWPVVSELLRAGVDPRECRAPATLLYLALVQGRGAMAAWLLVKLLAHLTNMQERIVGVAFAALVTRIMGITSPLQLLLRCNSALSFEQLLLDIGHVLLYIPGTFIPLACLPGHLYLLLSLFKLWSAIVWRR